VLRRGGRRGAADRQILLEQRTTSDTVMPGMWQLPFLREAVAAHERKMTMRHAIMQVNYVVHVRNVKEDEVKSRTVTGNKLCWVSLDKAAEMALTGLARKVLTRAGLLQAPI
jgi:A/G-specific adenine glycosylase